MYILSTPWIYNWVYIPGLYSIQYTYTFGNHSIMGPVNLDKASCSLQVSYCQRLDFRDLNPLVRLTAVNVCTGVHCVRTHDQRLCSGPLADDKKLRSYRENSRTYCLNFDVLISVTPTSSWPPNQANATRSRCRNAYWLYILSVQFLLPW